MPKKAIDARIPALIRNGTNSKHRTFFVVVGDRQKDVIVNLYHILLNLDIKLNKSVLWAYKNKLLGFSSHRKKREKKIKKEIKRGIRDADVEDPFELFVSTQNIRYVYYKETEKILGNTYGMCILQDFEAVTPNLLARTVETVEGGGLVLLLLKGMNSLKQLYTMSMDVHSRYRTEAHGDVVARFNERFILSLGSCGNCLVVDDEMNVLPISGGKNVIEKSLTNGEEDGREVARRELEDVKESFADTQPIGPLVQLARTTDQAKALLTFVEAIKEKTLSSTVALTAARGRGKSAALGVAIAAAIAYGYSNIFITSPSPENLKTLFEFVFKGFDALGYLDHSDYTIIQSTNPDFNKAIVRVNVHRQHRQTIQYIQPQDAYTLGQAELLVIDEAAAIPLPLVRKLMGPYLVFMASTINGYEGTGRSLSLKLVQQLREQSRGLSKLKGDEKVTDRTASKHSDGANVGTSSRSLREITLSDPIRYAQGDPVESWLNRLLCLDATLPRSMSVHGTPHPSECQLLQVNRDTLFSFHPVSEKFLQSMMALYVASHYKNSPNDLQLMSDAPAHQLFVLVPPVKEDTNRLPDILCVLQVALEGQISRESVLNSLSRGQRAGGDLIPWLVSQQFQDSEFAGLSGARVVRIATNPDHAGMGYGSRALQLLTEFYEGKHVSLDEGAESQADVHEAEMTRVTDAEIEQNSLLTDNVKVRDIHAMPPLFARLSERRPAALDYLGVSYGLTQPLHKFWKRGGFVPVYMRQTANELTGEHTCVMLRTLDNEAGTSDPAWLGAYAKDFHRRFLSLLSYQFRQFGSVQALAIDESAHMGVNLLTAAEQATPLKSKAELDALFSPWDLKRLDSYADNMLDWHVILDLMPHIASLFFTGRIRNENGIRLSGVQQALLCAVGLQRKGLEDVERELGLQIGQVMAMFVKVVRKVATHFRSIQSGAIQEGMPAVPQAMNGGADEDGVNGGANVDMETIGADLNAELADAGAEFERDEEERARIRGMIDTLPLEKYAAANGAAGWQDAERQVRDAEKKGRKSATVSVKSQRKEEGDKGKRKAGEALAEVEREAEKLGGKKKMKKGW
ncbi:N-acetyltransferase 10 [Saxophila tyrrhenica]|uniref:RNA cytidine acetyltransferase n=1 Tax=Saxophila tyrrhenica TaxID=1690608 RepID=A0AAV9PFE8_9PEZI|nr:N-acetyltransferase 10 [Saxophila tyrrhenica]